MTHTTEWDAIVLGGGAAGLSAGVVLARTGARVVLVEDRTPRNAPAAHMHGFLSRDGMSPAALLQTGREEMAGFGGKLLAARATSVTQPADGKFVVALEEGSELSAPAILLATGLRDELPGIPGVSELWGGLVHHCPHCHGREVAGQRIAVIGGANRPMSVHQAGLMRRYSDAITFYLNGIELADHERAQLDAIGVAIVDGQVSAVARTDAGALAIAHGGSDSSEHDCAFVAPLFSPRSEAFEGLGLARVGESPWIEAGPTGRTSVGGVWVAGNLANPRAQVITAAGEGSAAAIDMAGYLLEHDLGRAVNGEPASWYVR
ncbi:NAD(P)/FAD-dependent oxidoreductase [Leucobacter albus]|uniref:NAD(P)/FAD-dependent oxidoreductase n=1 Tax=Leucobacter albus TaxID=272210 RepID=A0ABW3TNQ0_9MICO